MLADGFTKPLPREPFGRMVDGLGLISGWGGVLDFIPTLSIPVYNNLQYLHSFPYFTGTSR
jgi:hypothetical protein